MNRAGVSMIILVYIIYLIRHIKIPEFMKTPLITRVHYFKTRPFLLCLFVHLLI